MSHAADLLAPLARLSREDRTLAVTACTLAGRRAVDLAKLLTPGRAAAVTLAIEAALKLPVKERMSVLAAEARRLALTPRIDTRSLHPERSLRILATAGDEGSPLASLVHAALAGPTIDRASPADSPRAKTPSRAPNPAVLAVLDSFLREHLSPPPWPDELAAMPPPLRPLLQAPQATLEAATEALGPSRLRTLLEAMPSSVASWLTSRLAPTWDERLASAEPAPADAALAALERLTRGART